MSPSGLSVFKKVFSNTAKFDATKFQGYLSAFNECMCLFKLNTKIRKEQIFGQMAAETAELKYDLEILGRPTLKSAESRKRFASRLVRTPATEID